MGLFLLLHAAAVSQTRAKADSSAKKRSEYSKVSVALYARAIFDARGRVRMDENVVGNFKLGKWIRLEAGFRQGERPQVADAYYHYKLELQSRYFWRKVRVFARLSHDIFNYPSPSYRKTNELLVAEGRQRLGKAWQVVGGLGYLFSTRNAVPDALPSSSGLKYNVPVYRISLRYTIKENSAFDVAYGTYDVFNPYRLNEPFAQIAMEQELSELCTFFTYFRYQFKAENIGPINYFLCAGVKLFL